MFTLSEAATASRTKVSAIPQITVLDTGGQYAHLIARRVRELGVFSDVQPSDIAASELRSRKGIIISGGPASVYEAGSPTIDPQILKINRPVLGICYGHQLIAHHLGGRVEKGERGEYGLAHLTLTATDKLWVGIEGSQIWMSHRDTVNAVPPGFRITASSGTSGVAAMSSGDDLFGLQFHPEVVHTKAGRKILENFVLGVCGAERDWDISQRVPIVEEQIRTIVGDRNVFFFVSGGVDSTVAYILCLRALGPDRVHGVYVDTGLMRQSETALVRQIFGELGARNFAVEDAEPEFLAALERIHEPEAKRSAIGEQFVKVQERILASERYLARQPSGAWSTQTDNLQALEHALPGVYSEDGHWVLGQGTIYPDTIESGGSAKAELIKTHHNRVAGIQLLIEAGRIVEPLTSFYKDEVREIGRELGVPAKFLARHPFPGPGLAIRCLCSDKAAELTEDSDGVILPVRSVGVQGDSRSYRNVLVIPQVPTAEQIERLAPELTNRRSDINRVVALCGANDSLASMRVFEAAITKARLDLLREADAIVRRFCVETGFEEQVWQFPVVLLPVGINDKCESIVLRPVNSVDGMTADVVLMGAAPLQKLTSSLLRLPNVAAVFYDLTHKPPGTIEWE